jgi:hypothetical protein
VIGDHGGLHPFPGHELLPEAGSGAEDQLRAADIRDSGVSAFWLDLRDGQGRVSVLWDLMTKESDHLDDPLDLDMHQTCSFTFGPAKSNDSPATSDP